MSSTADPEFTLEEKIVFYAIAFTWLLYALGALYVAGPVIGVTLAAIYFARAYASPMLPAHHRPHDMPVSIMVFIGASVVLLIALIVGHFYQHLSPAQTIKSSIGWAKGWALLAIYPLAGACLRIRMEVLTRANGWFALTTLCIIPILIIAPSIGLPGRVFVSPLKAVGGPGPEYFTFFLYTIDPESGAARLQFTAPWAPAAGFVGSVMLVLAAEEKRLAWRILGIVAACAMVLLCRSRMALLCMMLAWPMAYVIGQFSRGWPALLGSFGALFAGLFAPGIVNFLSSTMDRVNGMRAGSNRVRGALNDMAFDRWWTEAPIWGHAVVERGNHYVEYMPIGSHHTWLGLLYIKGAVGFVAFLFAMLWQTIELIIAAQRRPEARGGLAITFIMWFFSFSENLEILAYIYWPGLIMVGMGLRAAAEEARLGRSVKARPVSSAAH